jgi:proteasome component ECM29
MLHLLLTRPNIKLPMDSLLTIYSTKTDTQQGSSFVQNFTIIYLRMGLERLDVYSQADLAPRLLQCLEDKPQQHQESFLFLLQPALGSIKFSPSQSLEEKKETIGLSTRPITRKMLLGVMFDTLLLPYGIYAQAPSSEQGMFHDQTDARLIVIRRPLRGHNDIPCGRPSPG